MQTTCQQCGTEFRTYPSRLARGEDRYCSRECSNPARGRAREANPNWGGGRFVRSDGYVSVRVDGRNVLEHRHVMEGVLGRALRSDEHVHHRNEVKHDNRPGNLVVLSVADHAREHHDGPDESRWAVVPCGSCGRDVRRRRVELARHPNAYCDRECYKRDAANLPGSGR